MQLKHKKIHSSRVKQESQTVFTRVYDLVISTSVHIPGTLSEETQSAGKKGDIGPVLPEVGLPPTSPQKHPQEDNYLLSIEQPDDKGAFCLQKH